MEPIINIKIEADTDINTFILMWNPSISSYTMERFETDLADMANGGFLDGFNWSVWEHTKAKEGDHFFMVKVGPGSNGIVMCGIFTSDPYISEDWSSKGRVVHYMDMDVDLIIHPDKCPLLSAEILSKEIPDFTWDKGHSGQLLSHEQASKLKQMWEKYLEDNSDIFKPRAAKIGN